MSAREYALLEYLAHRAGQIASCTELRKKIDHGCDRKRIHTRRGQGDVLGEDR